MGTSFVFQAKSFPTMGQVEAGMRSWIWMYKDTFTSWPLMESQSSMKRLGRMNEKAHETQHLSSASKNIIFPQSNPGRQSGILSPFQRWESQGSEKSRCSPGVKAIVSGRHSTPALCVYVWLTMLLRNTVHQPVCLEGAKLTLPQLRIPNNRLIWKGCQVHMTMPVVKRKEQRHVAVQKYLKTIFKKNHWPGASFEFWIPLSQTFPTSFVFM